MFGIKRYTWVCMVITLQCMAQGRDPFQFYQQCTSIEQSTAGRERAVEVPEAILPSLPLNQWNIVASSAKRIVLKSLQGDIRIVELQN